MTTTKPKPERVAQLPSLHLDTGSHSSPGAGLCATEAVAFIAGERHCDHPTCLCPVLGAFLRSWNDGIRDQATRDKLIKPFLPRVVGTAGDGHAEARAWMAADWQVRVSAPAWLDLAGLSEHAEALRGLPEVTAATRETWEGPLHDARRRATAAGAAAGAAVWEAAGAAARDAARAAVWEAAGAAAWDAARAAARDALAPTVAELQPSAGALLERMVALGEEQRQGVSTDG